MASDRVTAANPPLVSDASAEGRLLRAWSTRLVVTFTMCPLPWATMVAIACWVMLKNAAQVDAADRSVVGGRVVGEGLADVDTGVVDDAVDPPEVLERPHHDSPGRLDFGDIALDGEEVLVVRCRHRPRDAHHR